MIPLYIRLLCARDSHQAVYIMSRFSHKDSERMIRPPSGSFLHHFSEWTNCAFSTPRGSELLLISCIASRFIRGSLREGITTVALSYCRFHNLTYSECTPVVYHVYAISIKFRQIAHQIGLTQTCEVVLRACSFLDSQTYEIPEILEVLGKIHPLERKDVYRLASKWMRMNPKSTKHTLEIFWKLGREASAFNSLAEDLIGADQISDHSYLLECLYNVPTMAERVEVCRFARPWMERVSRGMEECSYSSCFARAKGSAISDIHRMGAARKDVLELVEELIREKKIEEIDQQLSILSVVAKCAVESDVNQVVSEAVLLSEAMPEVVSYADAISFLSELQRDEIVQIRELLVSLSSWITPREIEVVSNRLNEIPPFERNALSELAKELMQDRCEEWALAFVLGVIGVIPIQNRDREVADLFLLLCEDRGDENKSEECLALFSGMDPEIRLSVCKIALDVSNGPRFREKCVLEIIRTAISVVKDAMQSNKF